MRIAELHDSYGRRVAGYISANKEPRLLSKPIQQPLLMLCVKLYEESVTCQGQFKRFCKILVTTSAKRVRNFTSGPETRHNTASMVHIKLPALLSGARLAESIGLAPHCLRDISILRELLQVFCADARQDVHCRGNRRPRIFGKVVNNRVRANPGTI
jgi:hypothetical protein